MQLETEKPMVEAERVSWRKRARQFLGASAGQSNTIVEPAPKRHRKNALQWILSADHALGVAAGYGLERFQVLDSEGDFAMDPWEAPSLAMCADQGPDGNAALNFLQFGPLNGMNIDRIDDPAHGVHNDLLLTLKQVGLWPHQMLMNLSRSVLYGPWDEGRRHIEAREAVMECVTLETPWTCPLFASLIPSMLEDTNEQHRLSERDIAETLWHEVEQSPMWHSKGKRLSVSRFVSMVTKPGEDTSWTFRYLSYLYICLQTGSYSENRIAKAMADQVKVRTPKDDELEQSMPTRRGADLLAQTRAITKNLLELATLMYGDEENKYRQRVVCVAGASCAAWQGEQSARNRSVQDAVKWEIEQLSGGFMGHLRRALEVLSNEDTLSRCGMEMSVFGDRRRRSPEMEHPVVQWNQEQANLLGQFATRLVGLRVVRCMVMVRGWPRRCVLALSPPHAQQVLQDFRDDLANFRRLEEMGSSQARRMVARSLFQTTIVKQYAAVFESVNFVLTLALVAWLGRKHRRLVGTQLIEDGFNRERRAEQSSTSGAIGCDRIWHTLVKRKVLGEVHRFDECSGRRSPWSPRWLCRSVSTHRASKAHSGDWTSSRSSAPVPRRLGTLLRPRMRQRRWQTFSWRGGPSRVVARRSWRTVASPPSSATAASCYAIATPLPTAHGSSPSPTLHPSACWPGGQSASLSAPRTPPPSSTMCRTWTPATQTLTSSSSWIWTSGSPSHSSGRRHSHSSCSRAPSGISSPKESWPRQWLRPTSCTAPLRGRRSGA